MKPINTLVPLLLGAVGSVAATMVPAYYHAVCGGALLPGISLPLGG